MVAEWNFHVLVLALWAHNDAGPFEMIKALFAMVASGEHAGAPAALPTWSYLIRGDI